MGISPLPTEEWLGNVGWQIENQHTVYIAFSPIKFRASCFSYLIILNILSDGNIGPSPLCLGAGGKSVHVVSLRVHARVRV